MSKILQQVVIAPGKIEMKEIDIPQPQKGQVLLKIKRIAICGSEIHVFHGKHPGIGYPITQGHEISAEIVKIGDEVEGFEIGQIVTIEPQEYCGKCYLCTHGKYHLCEELKVYGFQTIGTASEYFAIDASKVVVLPETMTLEEGALIEPLACTVRAAKQYENMNGAKVVILGCGPIGLLLAQTCKALGAKEILITDISDYRLQLAKQCGVEYTVNVKKENFEEIYYQTFGKDRADVFFDCAGTEMTISQAVKFARKGTKIIMVAVFEKPAPVDLAVVNDHELEIKGSLMYQHEDYADAIRLVKDKKIQLEALISKHFNFLDYQKAYEYIHDNYEYVMKVIIDVN